MKNSIWKAASTIIFSLCLAGTSLAQWNQTNGPFGGPVSSISVSGSNIIVTGGDANTVIFRSTNNGGSWSQNTIGSENGTESLVASGSNVFFSDYYSGVSLSTDFGKSWTVTSLNDTVLGYQHIGNFFVSGTWLYARTQRE